MSLSDAIQRNPVVAAIVAVVVGFLPWLATLWPAFVRDKTIPEWLAERGLFGLSPRMYAGLAVAAVVLVALVTWRTRPKKTTKAVIEVSVSSGTQPMINVRSVGDAFTLVTRATLVDASPPGIDGAALFQFIARRVPGCDGLSRYTIATLDATPPTMFGYRIVEVRGEHMTVVKQWETNESIWFKVEWVFQELSEDQRLTTLATVVTHVELSADLKQLVATKTDTSFNAGQLTVNTGALQALVSVGSSWGQNQEVPASTGPRRGWSARRLGPVGAAALPRAVPRERPATRSATRKTTSADGA